MGLFDRIMKKAAPTAAASIPVQEEAGILLQPIDGEIIPLKDLNDGVFSEGILGQGCGLVPSAEAVYAPVSGTVSTVADTKHAVGLETPDGVEMLIHVGLETVSMNGNGFDVKVKAGDKVKAGQLLMTFSLAEIEKAEGVESRSAVLVTNADDQPVFEVLRQGAGKAGDKLFRVK